MFVCEKHMPFIVTRYFKYIHPCEKVIVTRQHEKIEPRCFICDNATPAKYYAVIDYSRDK